MLVQAEDPQGPLVRAHRDSGVTLLESMKRVAGNPHSLGEKDGRQFSAQSRRPEAFSERFELSTGLRKWPSNATTHVR